MVNPKERTASAILDKQNAMVSSGSAGSWFMTPTTVLSAVAVFGLAPRTFLALFVIPARYPLGQPHPTRQATVGLADGAVPRENGVRVNEGKAG